MPKDEAPLLQLQSYLPSGSFDAVIFIGMCMPVIAEYTFPLTADGKMNFVMLQVKNHLIKTSGW